MQALSSTSDAWHHGYYSGSGYTYNAYPEFFPHRLAFCALLAGHRPPQLDLPFRLVEFGCGQGIGLCLQAALFPQASFRGIDLLPAHINHARGLAAAAELGNLRLQEADLIDLAGSGSPDDRSDDAGSFDLAVCHGMLSWVGREVQQALWQLASTWLRPCGVFALSYNAFPGKLDAQPFQHLVRALQQGSSPTSIASAAELAGRLRTSGAAVFQALPGLGALLDGLSIQDPDYLPHEYNQRRWQPRYADAVIRHAGEQGFSFCASATLPESFDGLLPQGFSELLAGQDDPALRQLLRDLLTNNSFRRDVYARGLDRLWPLEHTRCLNELKLLRLVDPEQLERQKSAQLFRFELPFGVVQGQSRWFAAFLHALGEGPRPLAELQTLPDVPGISPPELLQNLALLLHKNLVAFAPDQPDPGPSQRLNRVLTGRVREGAPYRSLAAPAIGSALSLSELDLLALDAMQQGLGSRPLHIAIDAALADLGREVSRNADPEAPPLDAVERKALLQAHAETFERRTLPLLRRLGAVD